MVGLGRTSGWKAGAMEMGMGIGKTEWQLSPKLDTWLLVETSSELLEERHTFM
jgi:hypothetical protein